MKNKLIVFFVLLGIQSSIGQQLTIGDKLPQETFDAMVLLDGSQVSYEDHQGKYVIFEFWSTWCTNCIDKMPMVQKIQDKFKDSVSVFLVNSQDKDMLETFWKKNPITQSLDMSIIKGDVKLKEHFPRKGVPYTVWLDKDLTVRYLMHGRYLTEENVHDFLLGNDIDVTQ